MRKTAGVCAFVALCLVAARWGCPPPKATLVDNVPLEIARTARTAGLGDSGPNVVHHILRHAPICVVWEGLAPRRPYLSRPYIAWAAPVAGHSYRSRCRCKREDKGYYELCTRTHNSYTPAQDYGWGGPPLKRAGAMRSE
jgi:hypothetical protein